MIGTARALFTAPWDPVATRRGDALGLRALTDVFADLVAPEMNYRINDARWLTILAWCLVHSNDVYHKSAAPGAESLLDSRAGQRARYRWLRPLELMWVRRTIAITPNEGRLRALPGQRTMRAAPHATLTDQCGLSTAQLEGYRQTGAYGAYRLAFRRWPRLTRQGDGFTPDAACRQLAEWLSRQMTDAPVLLGGSESITRRSALRGVEDPYRFWEIRCPAYQRCAEGLFDVVDRLTLPRPYAEMVQLPEAHLLRGIIFGTDRGGRQRESVARRLEASQALTHLELCQTITDTAASDSPLRMLHAFSKLADAGMDVVHRLASALHAENSLSITAAARRPEIEEACAELADAAQAWRNTPRTSVRHSETADVFATAARSADPATCLKAVVQHHEIRGGGIRWFGLRGDTLEARAMQSSESSGYRFRLAPLYRLAVQCGVVHDVPPALSAGLTTDADALTDEEDA